MVYKYFDKPRVITCVECNCNICVQDNNSLEKCLCSCIRCHNTLKTDHINGRKLCSCCKAQYCFNCKDFMELENSVICQCRCIVCFSPISRNSAPEGPGLQICETCIQTCTLCFGETSNLKQLITFTSCIHRVCRKCCFERLNEQIVKGIKIGGRPRCPICAIDKKK